MLFEASDDDNLFQCTPDMLASHLKTMKKIRVNYIRNTMKDCKSIDSEIYPFKQLENGKHSFLNLYQKNSFRMDFTSYELYLLRFLRERVEVTTSEYRD